MCEHAVLAEFADSGSLSNMFAEDETTINRPTKRKKNITLIRKKRLKRNRMKKEERKRLSKRERRHKIKEKLALDFNERINDLENKLSSAETLYKQERRISAYCWRKWKEENRLTIQTHRFVQFHFKLTLNYPQAIYNFRKCFFQ